MTINGFKITKLEPGWEFAFAADNPNTGQGDKFFTIEAAIAWCERQ